MMDSHLAFSNWLGHFFECSNEFVQFALSSDCSFGTFEIFVASSVLFGDVCISKSLSMLDKCPILIKMLWTIDINPAEVGDSAMLYFAPAEKNTNYNSSSFRKAMDPKLE